MSHTDQETPMPTTTPQFETAICARCGGLARLTRGGWRHGWPPAGHDGHCPGTGYWPVPVDGGAYMTSPTGVEVVAEVDPEHGWTIDGFGYLTADEVADMGYRLVIR